MWEAVEAFGVTKYHPRKGSGKQIRENKAASIHDVLDAVGHARREVAESNAEEHERVAGGDMDGMACGGAGRVGDERDRP